MEATVEWDPDRRESFQRDLTELIAKYPEFQLPVPCDCGETHTPEDYNPADARILVGSCLIMNFETISGFGELIWVAPPGQNPYYTMGMVQHVYNMM
jgi:hypothetical protein